MTAARSKRKQYKHDLVYCGAQLDIPSDLKHIYWRSRRGMLELELKLVPFVRDEFHKLSPAEQTAYEAMLAEEDWMLYDWIQGKAEPEDAVTRQLIAKIVAYTGSL